MLMDEKNMGKKLLRKRTELRREMEMFVIDRNLDLNAWWRGGDIFLKNICLN